MLCYVIAIYLAAIRWFYTFSSGAVSACARVYCSVRVVFYVFYVFYVFACVWVSTPVCGCVRGRVCAYVCGYVRSASCACVCFESSEATSLVGESMSGSNAHAGLRFGGLKSITIIFNHICFVFYLYISSLYFILLFIHINIYIYTFLLSIFFCGLGGSLFKTQGVTNPENR